MIKLTIIVCMHLKMEKPVQCWGFCAFKYIHHSAKLDKENICQIIDSDRCYCEIRRHLSSVDCNSDKITCLLSANTGEILVQMELAWT